MLPRVYQAIRKRMNSLLRSSFAGDQLTLQETNSLLRSPLDITEDQLRDCLKLHVGGSFVDLADLRVAVILLGGIVLRVAVAAVELYNQRSDVLGCLG